MTFYKHELTGSSPPTGEKDSNGNFTFKIIWRLYANEKPTAGDGPDAAIDYVEAHIAEWGDRYRLEATPAVESSSSSPAGPEAVDQNRKAKLKTIAVAMEKGSEDPWVWLATLSYEETPGGNQDPESFQEDPLDLDPEIDIQTVQLQRPMEKAQYVEGCDPGGNSHALLDGGEADVDERKKFPIVNSALSVYDPPPEAEDHRWIIRIKRNVAALDCDTVKCNVVNSAEVKISYRSITKTIGQYKGKTRDISATPARHPITGNWYVQVQFYIDVEDKIGFRPEFLDRGFSARALDGDPNGKGGIIVGGGGLGPTDEMAPQRRLCDTVTNQPFSEPQLLDGDGQPLQKWDNTSVAQDPVYIKWKYYEESDYSTWPILEGILEEEEE